MFCPNCGTKNQETATACVNCGFSLSKGPAASKFKGTMVMTAPTPADLAATRASAPTPGDLAASSPVAPAAQPVAAAPAAKAFKGTMIGVAPPGLQHAAGTPGQNAPPASPGGFGGPPGAPAPGFGGPTPAPQPQAAQPVNPLGGTMAIDQVPFPVPSPSPAAPAPGPGGFGAPQGGPAPSAPTSPDHHQPAQANPHAQPGYGAPAMPPPAGFGGPPAAGFGAPPQPGAYGGQPGYQQPAPGMAPYAGGAPMASASYGGTGPKGSIRNPLMVMILTFVTCGIYGIFAMWGMMSELKAYLQKDEIQPIFMFIPVLNILQLIQLPGWVSEAKQRAGCANPESAGLILYWLFGIYFIPKDLNEVWESAR